MYNKIQHLITSNLVSKDPMSSPKPEVLTCTKLWPLRFSKNLYKPKQFFNPPWTSSSDYKQRIRYMVIAWDLYYPFKEENITNPQKLSLSGRANLRRTTLDSWFLVFQAHLYSTTVYPRQGTRWQRPAAKRELKNNCLSAARVLLDNR